MKACLTSSEGKSITLKSLSDIGRHEGCLIVLQHNEVSRRHTLICRDRQADWLIDLNSRNGTWLNGVRIGRPVRLKHGDELRIASYSFRYFVEPAAPVAPPISSTKTTEPAPSLYIPSSHAALVLNKKHEPVSQSDEARRLLLGYFSYDADAPALPEAITQWLSGGRARAWPLVVKRDEFKLVLRYCDGGENQHIVFLTEEQPALGNASLKKKGLTERECDVVRWIITGKSNKEIALILQMSHRTTEKHVQRILTKLGVDTRAAAVSLILQQDSSR